MSEFKVSVVIPTKNAGLLFEQVLDSVLSQNTTWPYEVLVVDSGSSDGTVDYCLKNAVRVHQISPGEFGHGKTRNLGVSLTSGKFVVMITHDALPCDGNWLENMVSAMEFDDDIAGVFGRHYAYEESGLLVRRDLLAHFDGFKNSKNVVWNDDIDRYQKDIGYRQFLHFFSDNNACIRRSVWELIPYPEVDFAEDQLWAKLIIEAGYKKGYSDNGAVFHSHSYSVWQTFRRSFDESRALRRLFGYKLCGSILIGVAQVFRCSINDCLYLIAEGGLIKNRRAILKAPFLALAKQAGYYLGDSSFAERGLGNLISLDRSLKRQ